MGRIHILSPIMALQSTWERSICMLNRCYPVFIDSKRLLHSSLRDTVILTAVVCCIVQSIFVIRIYRSKSIINLYDNSVIKLLVTPNSEEKKPFLVRGCLCPSRSTICCNHCLLRQVIPSYDL